MVFRRTTYSQKPAQLTRILVALTTSVGLFGLVCATILSTAPTATAATGTNPQINYQGRLLTNTGAVVPDGNYNMTFKVYQDGTGCVGGGTPPCSGTLLWTEAWQNTIATGSTSAVVVKNGYFSANLGSYCTFAGGSCQGVSNTGVNWNSDTLWLSVNVGGTAVTNTPTYDGEMTPFKRLTSSVYAFNSSQLGGLGAANFVQLAQGLQTDASTSQASIAINKTGGTANILDLQRGGADVLLIDNNGAQAIKPVADTTSIFNVKNSSNNNLFTIDSSNSRVGINLGSNNTPALAGAGLEINGAVRLSGSGTDTFITPQSASVGTKINVPLFSPGGNGQIIAVGIPNSAPTSSRVISIFDNRSVAGNQPALAVFAPNENTVVGIGFDGSNTAGGFYSNTTGTIGSAGINIYTGNTSAGTGLSTGSISLFTGNGSGTNTSSGSITLDTGTKTGTGTTGSISLGASNASAITLGQASANILTTIRGTAIVKPTTGNDSATAFQLQNSSGSTLFSADTVNSTINIGAATKLGITAVPGSPTWDGGDQNEQSAIRIYVPVSSTLSSISVYVGGPSGTQNAPNNKYQVAIYTDSGGGSPHPNTLVASTGDQTLTAAGAGSGAWNTATLSTALTGGSYYWIAYNTNATNANQNVLDLNTGFAQGVFSTWNSSTYGTWSTPYGAYNTGSSNPFVMYMNVVPSVPSELAVSNASATLNNTSLAVSGDVAINQDKSTNAYAISPGYTYHDTFSVGDGNASTTLRVDTNNARVGIAINASWFVGGGTAGSLTVGAGATIPALSVINNNQTGNLLTLGNTGQLLLQNSANSTTSLQIQNAAGENVLVQDTTTTNLLKNSGFESGSTNWAARGTTSAFATDATSTNYWHGKQALKATVTAATSGMGTTGGQAAFTANITTATQYQLTFMAKCSSSFATLTYGREDVAGTPINSTTTGSCTTSWQQFTAHWTTGGTITNPDIYVNLGATTAGSLWIDAVSLIQTNTNAATNYSIGSTLVGGTFTNPAIFKNNTDSTMAFQVQSAASITPVFGVNTASKSVGINTVGGSTYSLDIRTVSGMSGIFVQQGSATDDFIVTRNAANNLSPFTVNAKGFTTINASGADGVAFAVNDSSPSLKFGVDTAHNTVGINYSVGGTTDAALTVVNQTASNGGITVVAAASQSAALLQVQNSSSANVLSVSVTAGSEQTILGKIGTGGINGKLTFNSTNAANVKTTIAANSSQAVNIDYTLPTALASTGQCLQSGTVAGSTVPLTFAACAGGINLGTAYNADTGGTVPDILVGSALGGIEIQNKTSSGVSGANLFSINGAQASDITTGAPILFGVGDTGKTIFQNSSDTAGAFIVKTQGGTTLLNIDTTNTFGPGYQLGAASTGYINGSVGVSGPTVLVSNGTTTSIRVGGTTTSYGGIEILSDLSPAGSGGIATYGTATISPQAGNGTSAADLLTVQNIGLTGGNTTGTTGQTAGHGAGLVFLTGAGGASTGTSGANTGGTGGYYTLQGGTGGAAQSTGGGTGGSGGVITLTAGSGGAETGATGSNFGGAAGTISLVGGTGGAATSGTGGAGSSINLTAGNGGNGTTLGGNGGNITLKPGIAGTGGSPVAGNVIIGSATSDATQSLLQVDSYSTFADTSTCSTTVNQGALYYNSATASAAIRTCTNGTWSDVMTIEGYGLMAYGVVANSGSNPGDVASLVTAGASGPCKVSWASTTSVNVAACIAYSGGRKVNVASTTLTITTTTALPYENVCLSTTTGQAVLIGPAATQNSATIMPTFSTTAPVVCLATIKNSSTVNGNFTGAAQGLIYDVRTFTDTTKEFDTVATAGLGLGYIAQASSSGVTATTNTLGTGLQRGVVVASTGGFGNTTPDVIIATAGPAQIVSTAGTNGAAVVVGGTTASFAATSATTTFTMYAYLGISQTNFNAACTSASTCIGSMYTNLSLR